MAEINEREFVDVVLLRNQLANVSEEQLVDVYQDYENYITFIASVRNLSEIDGAFLLYRDEFIKKIHSVVNVHRYDSKEKLVVDTINEIIGYLNTITSFPDSLKAGLREEYKKYHEDVRKRNIPSDSDLIHLLAYDAIVYAGLVNDNLGIIDNDNMFLSSMNYFLETIPEMFNDETVRDNAFKRMSMIKCRSIFSDRKFKTYMKETMKNYMSKGIKGE